MIRIDENYTDFRDDTDPNYPGGKAVDAPTSESVEGTPFLARWMNCLNGFRQALFQKAFGSLDGISGEPDNANVSDTVDAINELIDNTVNVEAQARIQGDAETLVAAEQRILDAQLATNTWLPSVNTVALLPAASGLAPEKNYLCKVLADPDIDNNIVWQLPAGAAAWAKFSDMNFLPPATATDRGGVSVPGGNGLKLNGDALQMSMATPQAAGAISGMDKQRLDLLWGSVLRQVSAGSSHTVAVKNDGSLWAWGSNDFGQLGDGTATQRASPVRIGRDNDWDCVAAGMEHTLAIKTDGSLWAWGNNANGRTGLGTSAGQTLSPMRVGTATGWVFAAASQTHTLAIRADGSLWAWGSNTNGRLGDGTTSQRTSPVRVGTDADWAGCGAGDQYSLGVRKDGTLWGWGNSAGGRIGILPNGNVLSPMRVGVDMDWAYVSAGTNHGMAIKTDGSLWAWGNNVNGRTGLNVSEGTTDTPARVGSATNWAAVSAGSNFTVAVRADGTLWGWGNNANGRIGLGTTTSVHVPARIGSGASWIRASAGEVHSVAIGTDGASWACGLNMRGQLGDGTTTTRTTLVLIETDGAVTDGAIVGVAAPANGNANVGLLRIRGGSPVPLPNAVGGTDAERRAGMMSGVDKQKLDTLPAGVVPLHTFVIDSNAALAAWASNAAGNDYSRILIKAGTWTLNYSASGGTNLNPLAVIDISNGRTISVAGESGSIIRLNSTITAATRFCGIRGNPSDTTTLFLNVRVEINRGNASQNFAGSAIAFCDCNNLIGCTGMGARLAPSLPENNYGGGFLRCNNLIGCTGTSTTGIGAEPGGAFVLCDNLTSCTGTNTTGNGGGGVFLQCKYLSGCRGNNRSIAGGAFSLCDNLTNCIGTNVANAFLLCNNLTGCVGAVSNTSSCFAFWRCNRLSHCTGEAVATGVAAGHIGVAFWECNNLTSCVGTGIGQAGTLPEVSCGFLRCRTGTGNRNGDTPSTVRTFHNCLMAQGTGNPMTNDWANTAEGGWNMP